MPCIFSPSIQARSPARLDVFRVILAAGETNLNCVLRGQHLGFGERWCRTSYLPLKESCAPNVRGVLEKSRSHSALLHCGRLFRRLRGQTSTIRHGLTHGGIPDCVSLRVREITFRRESSLPLFLQIG